MSVIEINKNNFAKEVLDSDKPVLMDFWATWCGPCRMIAPTVHEVAEEHPEIKVVKVNVDEEPELARDFGIVSIPTLVAVKDGQVAGTSVGLVEKSRILSLMGI